MFFAVGLCLIAGAGYIYIQNKNGNEETTGLNSFSVREDQALIFDSFVIPSRESHKFTYISLSISFRLPNIEIRGEMIEKKHRVRGIIYDTLRKEINKAKEVPPLDKLKECIIRVVNEVLSAGELNEAYIIHFLAV